MTEPFREEIRYEYPELTPESVVLDCGGYEGDFADGIESRYGCKVCILEPVGEFFEKCCNRFFGRHNIQMSNLGICGNYGGSGYRTFRIKGNMSGENADDGEAVIVNMILPKTVFMMFEAPRFDLVKLNIEGMEFEVLESMIEDGLTEKCGNIQVQWHPVVPDSEARRNAIMERLTETHELTWDYGWTWQNWRLRK